MIMKIDNYKVYDLEDSLVATAKILKEVEN